MDKFKQKNTLKYHYVFKCESLWALGDGQIQTQKYSKYYYVFKYESLWALGDGQIQTQKYSKYYYVFKYESFLLSFGSP